MVVIGVDPHKSSHTAAALDPGTHKTLRTVRPASLAERAREDLARDLVADIRALDTRLKASQKRMQEAVTDSGSSLPDAERATQPHTTTISLQTILTRSWREDK